MTTLCQCWEWWILVSMIVVLDPSDAVQWCHFDRDIPPPISHHPVTKRNTRHPLRLLELELLLVIGVGLAEVQQLHLTIDQCKFEASQMKGQRMHWSRCCGTKFVTLIVIVSLSLSLLEALCECATAKLHRNQKFTIFSVVSSNGSVARGAPPPPSIRRMALQHVNTLHFTSLIL